MRDLKSEAKERNKLLLNTKRAAKEAINKTFNGRFELGITDVKESRKAMEVLWLRLQLETGLITEEAYEDKLEKAFNYTYDSPQKIVDLIRKGRYDSNPSPKIKKECFEWIKSKCQSIGNFEFYPFKITSNERVIFGVNRGYFVDSSGVVMLSTTKYDKQWDLVSIETVFSIVQFIHLEMYKEL